MGKTQRMRCGKVMARECARGNVVVHGCEWEVDCWKGIVIARCSVEKDGMGHNFR